MVRLDSGLKMTVLRVAFGKQKVAVRVDGMRKVDFLEGGAEVRIGFGQ